MYNYTIDGKFFFNENDKVIMELHYGNKRELWVSYDGVVFDIEREFNAYYEYNRELIHYMLVELHRIKPYLLELVSYW